MSGGGIAQLVIAWTDDSGNAQSIDFDCSEEETYSTVAEVTEHAVEQGANIADHVRPHNDAMTFSGIVSNTPFVQPTFGMDGATGSVNGQSITVGGRSLSVNTWSFNQSFQRVFNVDQAMTALVKAGTPVTVTSGVRKQVPSCVVTGYKWMRSAENGNDLAFTLDVQQVRIATSQTTTVAAPRTRAGQQQSNQGSQPAVTDNRSTNARFNDLTGLHL